MDVTSTLLLKINSLKTGWCSVKSVSYSNSLSILVDKVSERLSALCIRFWKLLKEVSYW